MTRTEFAKVVANKMRNDYPNADISDQDAKIWTVAVFDCLTDEILKQDRVTLLNFGSFEKYTTKEYNRWDINNKCVVADPSRVRLRFTPAKAFDKEIAELPVK